MKKEELQNILGMHKLWLFGSEDGKRADLREANLCGADLYGVDLRRADLRRANLCETNLCEANLCGADLREADLCRANLNRANLCEANLCGADLREADLCRADLYGADLRKAEFRGSDLLKADLREANLYGAYLCGAKNVPFLPQTIVCPEGGRFIGFKKVDKYIVKLEIPAEAKRSSATTRKCRCEFAHVLSITNFDGTDSGLNEITNTKYNSTVYCVGEAVYPDSFDEDRWNECSHGIHFFIARQEAVEY